MQEEERKKKIGESNYNKWYRRLRRVGISKDLERVERRIDREG